MWESRSATPWPTSAGPGSSASAGRAQVFLTDGSGPLPGGDGTFDRFVSTYVFDLLSPDDSGVMLDETRRLLGPDGLLCVVSLAPGATRATRLVSSAWTALWSRLPVVVGGCRPIDPRQLLLGWHIEHRGLVSVWGLTSEVVIAST